MNDTPSSAHNVHTPADDTLEKVAQYKREQAAMKESAGVSSKGALMGLQFAWELGYIIAVPAVVFGIGGAYVDKMLGTRPWLTLAGLILAFLVSAIGVVRKVKEIIAATPPYRGKNPPQNP